ncbi:ParB/RepB/Spo0J family partition protein [Pseudomonas sp. NPDC089406]|uniref:ParB/RepB/Spo0J family partition protein n=1 Tax=Pseudomonas sp. NPDC089406 TaxID=3364463 RepID=UPI00384C882B
MQKYKEHSDAKRYKDHINQLTRSIKAGGQQVAMKVVAAQEGGSYELASDADRPHHVATRFWLVDGHHRLEALKKAGIAEALVEVLPGLGLADAQVAARLANQQIIQSLSPLERTENAWAAFNLERDTYRKMPVKEAAALLMVSENTIKRFRDLVRQDGVKAGRVDADAPRDKVEEQLQAYWQRKTTWKPFSVITWTQVRKQRQEPSNRTSGAARKHIIKMAIVQVGLGEDGKFEPKDFVEALEELAREAGRPDGIAYLERKYKPKVYQPTTTDDYEAMDDAVDHSQLGLEVARMRAEEEASRHPGDF